MSELHKKETHMDVLLRKVRHLQPDNKAVAELAKQIKDEVERLCIEAFEGGRDSGYDDGYHEGFEAGLFDGGG